MLDARIASASNMIIQKSYFKKKVSLEEQKAQKEDRFRGRQSACMIHDYVRVTGAHDTVLDYADLFSITLRNDDVQDFETRWDEILLSMTKIPPDDILESLYKLRILESDQLKTVLELYAMEIHQKITVPNYQKLKTMVKRSIDQKLRLINFETGAVVMNRRESSGMKGTGSLLPVERKRTAFERRPMQFPARKYHERAKSTPKTAPSSRREVRLGRRIDSRATNS